MSTEKLENVLWDSANKLRGGLAAADYMHVVLGLIFLKYLSDKFDVRYKELVDEGKGYENDIDEYSKNMVFWIPEEARWSYISKYSKSEELGKILDEAFIAIEKQNPELKNILPKTYSKLEVDQRRLGELIDLFTNKLDTTNAGGDFFGKVYEYFMGKFARNLGQKGGEFYTPRCVVELLVEMIEPFNGKVYDPCCGSGGMFIQSAELVKSKQGNLNGINIYGQEKEPATYRLAKMNLALRGISHNLGDEADSSFTHDLHKGLYFNYIMANPPFNLKGWYNDNLKNDARWADYVTPPESNANYAWILHMLSHLKKADGVAGFLLANGALNDSDTLEIRKKLIQNDKVEAIVVLPRELFITTDISVTLWILNQNKKGGKYHGRNLRNREYEILFMDLRQWRENPVKGENKKKVRLVTEQIERAADIYHTWQSEGTDGTNYEVPELYRSVGIDEIESKGWTLTPSKYIEFIDHDLDIDYEKEMARIQAEMKKVLVQEKKSQQMLEDAFRGIGYGID